MTNIKALSDLNEGQKAIVTELETHNDIRRRLQDMGVIEGTSIECINKSPLGDPAAFLIRGAVIALRKEDSKTIKVKYQIEERGLA